MPRIIKDETRRILIQFIVRNITNPIDCLTNIIKGCIFLKTYIRRRDTQRLYTILFEDISIIKRVIYIGGFIVILIRNNHDKRVFLFLRDSRYLNIHIRIANGNIAGGHNLLAFRRHTHHSGIYGYIIKIVIYLRNIIRQRCGIAEFIHSII